MRPRAWKLPTIMPEASEMCGFTKQQAGIVIDKMRVEGLLNICNREKTRIILSCNELRYRFELLLSRNTKENSNRILRDKKALKWNS